MERFVSKPSEVEALFYDGSAETRDEIKALDEPSITVVDMTVTIETNNGPVTLDEGNWLVHGVSDWYPCDPETFEARWQVKGEATGGIDIVEVYPDSEGNFRWRKVSANHRKIASSGESFDSESNAIRAASRANPGCTVRVSIGG